MADFGDQLQPGSQPPRVAVIGAGVVGVSTALALRCHGAEVTLLERGEPGMACSYGNSGAISPGSVRTENLTWTLRQQQDPEIFAKLARWYPLGRVAEPADIAAAVAFLDSGTLQAAAS